MTQRGQPLAGFQPLSTVYTRALRLLGLVPAQRQLQTPLTVQPVQVVADVSDVSVPHSNPVFGGSSGVGAVAAEFAAFQIFAQSRLLRIRQISVTGATLPVLFVTESNGFIDNPIADAAGVFRIGIGPRVDAGTALILRGTSTVTPPVGGFDIEQAQFDVRPPLLIDKGFSLVIASQTSNTAFATAGFIWEEIPNQDDVANLGFPRVADSG